MRASWLKSALTLAGALLLGGCQTAPSSPPGPPGIDGSLCNALFTRSVEDVSHRFMGRGYATGRGKRKGFLILRAHAQRQSEGTYALRGSLQSLLGPGLLRRYRLTSGTCTDAADPRFAQLVFDTPHGGRLSLWLWGRDGRPAHQDRLMGFWQASPEGPATKVALWRR